MKTVANKTCIQLVVHEKCNETSRLRLTLVVDSIKRLLALKQKACFEA